MAYIAFACCSLALLQLAAAQTYVLDDSSVGRAFDGIGGLSGGGATSKLLPNYPDKQRNEILDYLFLPNFGASLQILKVEIGGDTQSTEGTEASHMHSSGDLNFGRGYEAWLMTEAKKRNPNIKLYGLAWGFPGWVGGGSGDGLRFPNVTASYLVSWVDGMMKTYKLSIDYIGIWNEKGWGAEWVVFSKVLRQALDTAGYSGVRIVASDSGWEPAKDVLADADLAQSVFALGAHYPATQSTVEAMLTEKQLWASEDYSTFNDDVGSGCWARLLNWNYVNGLMTSTISWNAVAAYYDDLPYARCGLMTANSPWSGHYDVSGPIWISAHTTQFTQIGWNYLKHGYGVGKFANGGTYVSLVSPDHSQFTMIIETASYNHSLCIRANPPPYQVKAQTVTFSLRGKLSGVSKLNVWRSRLLFGEEDNAKIAAIHRELDTIRKMQKLSSKPESFDARVFELEQSLVAAKLKQARKQGASSSEYFKQLDPISIQNGQFTLQLNVDEVYTLTTVSTAKHGSYDAPPADAPFPLPYTDNFQQYVPYGEPYNLVPQVGSFETRGEADCPAKPVAGFGKGKLGREKRSVRMFGTKHVHNFEMEPKEKKVAMGNQILMQTVTQQPVYWCPCGANPIAVIGNYSWSSVHVEYYGLLPDLDANSTKTIADGLMIAALVNKGGCDQPISSGLFLWIVNSTQKLVLTSDYLGKMVLNETDYDVLIGTVYHLTLIVDANKNLATGMVVDPHQHSAALTVALPAKGVPKNGFVGVGSSGWGYACYDELLVQAV